MDDISLSLLYFHSALASEMSPQYYNTLTRAKYNIMYTYINPLSTGPLRLVDNYPFKKLVIKYSIFLNTYYFFIRCSDIVLPLMKEFK